VQGVSLTVLCCAVSFLCRVGRKLLRGSIRACGGGWWVCGYQACHACFGWVLGPACILCARVWMHPCPIVGGFIVPIGPSIHIALVFAVVQCLCQVLGVFTSQSSAAALCMLHKERKTEILCTGLSASAMGPRAVAGGGGECTKGNH
jgi:hypothetical protein